MKKNYLILLVCMLLSTCCLFPMASKVKTKPDHTDTLKHHSSDKSMSDKDKTVPKSDERVSKEKDSKKDSLLSDMLTSEQYKVPRAGVIIAAAAAVLGGLSYLSNKAYNWKVSKDKEAREEEVRKMLSENSFARFIYGVEPKPEWFTRYQALLKDVSEIFPGTLNEWITSYKNPYDLIKDDSFNRNFDPQQRKELLIILSQFERDFLNKEMESIFNPGQEELLAHAQDVGLDAFLKEDGDLLNQLTASQEELLVRLQKDPSRALLREKLRAADLKAPEHHVEKGIA